jgi:uncharacterized protein YecT (DUF1311 family)
MLLAAIAAGALVGRDSEQLDRCLDKANTQLAMNSCANEEALRAEAEMRDIYQRLAVAARKEPGAVDKIEAAERAWIAYRGAYISR